MEKVKVILMGLGVVGKNMTGHLVKKKGLEIVGALDIDKEKVGKDLGEVAGLGKKLGVIVTDDAESLFSEIQADVVMHTVCVYLNEAFPQIRKPIEQGMNIISSAEELSNPYSSNPGLAAKLDKLAKKHGVTVLGSGSNPGFGMDYLLLALTALCSQVGKVKAYRRFSMGSYIEAKGVVARHFGFELTAEEFKKGVEEGNIIGHYGFIQQMGMISDRLGWKLDEIRVRFEPIMGDRGLTNGVRTIGEGIKDGEVKIELDHQGGIFPESEIVDRLVIEGVPNINAVISPGLPTPDCSALVMINTIPHVINAEPGIMTPADLPLFFALDNDVRLFLK